MSIQDQIAQLARLPKNPASKTPGTNGHQEAPKATRPLMGAKPADIEIQGARQNNLKNIRFKIPQKKITVVTGLSGSGKSSIAFDTLYAEGQRRYIESLSTYTRQFIDKMPKPDVDHIYNIPPAIALEQRNTVLNSRSTVGTQTELVDYLRVLFARAGEVFCHHCGGQVKTVDAETLVEAALKWFPKRKVAILAPIKLEKPSPQKKGRGKKKKKKVEKNPAAQLKAHDLLAIIREQGFRRVVWFKKNASEPILLDLEDIAEADFPKIPNTALARTELWIVVDRLRLSAKQIKEEKKEIAARLFDSINQAIRVGHRQVDFLDLDSGERQSYLCQFACVVCSSEHLVPQPNLFSFNSPLGACPECNGFGHNLEIDEALVVPDPHMTIKNGAIDPLSKPSMSEWQKAMFRFAERHGINIGKRYSELTAKQKRLLWEGDPADDRFGGILACFDDLAYYKYKIHVRVFIRRYQSQSICRSCNGGRLNPAALAVKIDGKNISDVLHLPIQNSYELVDRWVSGSILTASQKKISEDVLTQIHRRLKFLVTIGVHYLTLARLTKTLSGGEFQRINLATQLGSGLCGTLYVLDEPSIGLHAEDSDRLIQVLKDLRNQGNTVVVVEHDLDLIKTADHLIEIGPGAGSRGGELIAQGPAHILVDTPGSITGKYLSGIFKIGRVREPKKTARKHIKITGCREHNLKNTDVEIPLNRFVVVSGLSGSGKSTLIHKTLYPALLRATPGSLDVKRLHSFTGNQMPEPGAYDQLFGAEQVGGVVLLDQKPIGKSSRSNPATYLKAWDEVRRIYANQVLSVRRGYTTQHFSFNVDGGRCPECKGEGEITLDMHFMAEVRLPCEECGGKRFKKDVLGITYRGKNIHQLLNTTIDESIEIFRDNGVLSRKLSILRDVGLGYLKLGQSATTLSGGESQRLKIASVLDEKVGSSFMYLFDEPTTGLHLEDVKKLLYVIHDLIDAGHSVVMIEHHLDVIAQADWLIDLGPEGGENGGQLIAAGPPEQVIQNLNSATGRALAKAGYRYPSARDQQVQFQID